MANVGGDPSAMTGGAAVLHRTGTGIGAAGREIERACRAAAGAAGDTALTAALRRLGAGLGTAVEDTGTQVCLAGSLAAHAAQDLDAATGGAP